MAYQISLICIFLYFFAEVQGGCHECQSNFAVCHDEKRFSLCTDGISESKMQTCPNDFVCTDKTEICVRSSTNNPVPSTCDAGCGICNSPDKLFACLNEKTYAYCFGADSYDSRAEGQCPDGYVCNLGSRQICIPASDAYPSCFEGSSIVATTESPIPSTSDTTPTTSTQHPRDESAFCQSKQNRGFYKAENDPTCSQYIMCYILSGQYLGLRYTCPDDNYFNEKTNDCETAKPAGC